MLIKDGGAKRDAVGLHSVSQHPNAITLQLKGNSTSFQKCGGGKKLFDVRRRTRDSSGGDGCDDSRSRDRKIVGSID